MKAWVIYGANGYTGRLITEEAVRRGLKPTLAGRNRGAIEHMAKELDLDFAVFPLDDRAALDHCLASHDVVLHCAGPFSATAGAMIDSCLRQGCHYLDITGEIPVFESAWNRSGEAQRRDVILCPGAGFDVVPTDCMAARLVEALPAATRLAMAFKSGGGLSPGTTKTSVEALASGGRVRRNGEIIAVPLAWKSRQIPFRSGVANAVTIPWGDVFTAWVTTGVGNIEIYLSMPPSLERKLRRLNRLRPVLGLGWVQRFLKWRIERKVPGPDAQSRQAQDTELWGQVESADGRKVTAQMTTPNGYDLTVTASLALVAEILSLDAPAGGYFTPSMLAGPGFAESLPGVSLALQTS